MGMFDSKIKEYTDNLDNIPKEYLDKAYEFLKEYCEKNNTTVTEFTQDSANIPVIAEAIHKEMPWLIRKAIKKEVIEQNINEHQDWIKTKLSEYEKPASTPASLKA
jgi:hypothetical protein